MLPFVFTIEAQVHASLMRFFLVFLCVIFHFLVVLILDFYFFFLFASQRCIMRKRSRTKQKTRWGLDYLRFLKRSRFIQKISNYDLYSYQQLQKYIYWMIKTE